MKIYYAPLESITGYPLRNVHRQLFPGMDRYYTPFLSANDSGKFTGKERRDLEGKNNVGIPLVPQLLMKDPLKFCTAVKTMLSFGYTEINLNLGCPSRTVTAKGKGAGMLRDPGLLDEFFEAFFILLEQDGLLPGKDLYFSVKTRLGWQGLWELREILPVINRYPFSEWIVHARLAEQFYRGEVHLDSFQEIYEGTEIPLSYNGDIRTREDFHYIQKRFPRLRAVMLGRGIVANPALGRECQGGEILKKEELRCYMDKLYQGYEREIRGERNLLFKLKEHWNYLSVLFPEEEKSLKEIRKAKNREEYLGGVRALFSHSAEPARVRRGLPCD